MRKYLKLFVVNAFVFIGMLSVINVFAIIFFKLDFKFKSLRNSNVDDRSYLPNYRNEEWSAKHFQEFNSLPAEYRSYVGWRRLEYKGVTINVDKHGIRNTPQSSAASADAPLIAFLGGSTTWGTGAIDSATIPSLVSFISNGKYRTINLGESGYNAFQSYLFLKLQVINGLHPNVIITYDGVNDELICGKRPYSHSREEQIISSMKNQDNSDHGTMNFQNALLNPIKVFFRRYIYSPELMAENKFENEDDYIQANRTNATVLLESWLAMKEIADQNNAHFIAILQPNAFVGNPQTDHLKLNWADSTKFKYYNDVFALLETPKFEKLKNCVLDYTNKFDISDYIYIDYCHVSPKGNYIIANSILDDLKRKIN